MNRETILDTIARLLALSGNNPNQNEAELAFLKAQELIIKHNIAKSELNLKQEKHFTEAVYQEFNHCTGEKHAICMVAKKYLVRPIFVNKYDSTGRRKIRLTLFGEKENIELATYVVTRFLEIGEQMWKKFRAANNLTRKHRPDFFVGLAQGYIQKLNEQQAKLAVTYGALVLLETELDNAFNNTWAKTKSISTKVRSDWVVSAGAAEGRKLNIQPSIKGSHSVRQIQHR